MSELKEIGKGLAGSLWCMVGLALVGLAVETGHPALWALAVANAVALSFFTMGLVLTVVQSDSDTTVVK